MKTKKRVLLKSKRSYVVLLLVVSSCFNDGFAQLSPLYDHSWGNKIMAASDEFNAGTVNTNKWIILPNLQNVVFNSLNLVCDPYFITGQGTIGALRFKFTANSTAEPSGNSNPGNFAGAGLVSTQNYPYKYGFYEIRAILPSYQDGNGNYTELGIIPQFGPASECWCGTNPGSCYPLAVHDEVDILEGDGFNNKDFGVDSHWHAYSTTGTCPYQPYLSSDKHLFQPSPATPMVNTFHKIGCELMPNRVIFYFDDVPVSTFNGYVDHYQSDILNSSTTYGTGVIGPIGTHTMGVYLDLAYGIIGNSLAVIDPAANVTPNPMQSTIEFIVDYFRYYQMNSANCNNNTIINGNTGLAGYTSVSPEIWYNITIAGTVNVTGASSSVIFRNANDFTVPLGATLEVPLSSDLTVIPTPCQ